MMVFGLDFFVKVYPEVSIFYFKFCVLLNQEIPMFPANYFTSFNIQLNQIQVVPFIHSNCTAPIWPQCFFDHLSIQNFPQQPAIEPPKDNLALQNKKPTITQESLIQRTPEKAENISFKKRNPLRRTKKSQEQDNEFRPNSGNRNKKKIVHQNNNRNIIPNIIHQILSFLQKKNKSQKILEESLASQKELDSSLIKKFYSFQSIIRDQLLQYVSIQSLEVFKFPQKELLSIYSEQEQLNLLQLSRKLIIWFLRSQFVILMLSSRRMTQQNKLLHLKYQRVLLQEIEILFSE